MKRYLVRAGFDPLKTYNPDDCVCKSFVGDNTGNLFFAYGVMNALFTEETEIEQTYKWKWTDEEADLINEKFDAFILPMADGFRIDFMEYLSGITNLVNRLTIPVVVIGVGLRAPYEPDMSSGFPFDEIVTDFVKAILEHSAIIGLRGEITYKYLEKLGFKGDRDFTVIGCPSLYTYGNNLHTRSLKDNIEKLAFNTNTLAPRIVSDFIIRTMKKIPDHYLVQQKRTEFLDMYIGRYLINSLFKGNKSVENIFNENDFKALNREDRIRFFVDCPSWLNFMSDFDLFIGNRFHGSVAAILSGVPHVIIPFDARTRELAEYHNITRIPLSELKTNSSIYDYITELDFSSCEKKHEKNFRHYVDFLNKSGLENIFRKKDSYERGESLMEKMSGIPAETVHCIESLNMTEKTKRILKCNMMKVKQKLGGK